MTAAREALDGYGLVVTVICALSKTPRTLNPGNAAMVPPPSRFLREVSSGV